MRGKKYQFLASYIVFTLMFFLYNHVTNCEISNYSKIAVKNIETPSSKKIFNRYGFPTFVPVKKKITYFKYQLHITVYNPDDICQTDSSPNIYAWGDKAKYNDKVVAVTRDLENLGLKYKSRIIIAGLGEFIVYDRMNRRFRRRIDISLFDKRSLHVRKKEAMQFGIQKRMCCWKGTTY